MFCRNQPGLLTSAETGDGKVQIIEALRKVLERLHDPLEVMLGCGSWCATHAPSLRHIEDLTRPRCEHQMERAACLKDEG